MTRRAYRGTVRHIDRYAHTASTLADAQREVIWVEERRKAREGIAAGRAVEPLDDDLGDCCVPDEDMRIEIDLVGKCVWAVMCLFSAYVVVRWWTG